ncbi:hypothetical protein [Natronococcus occultus]|uniref:Uncharacterized protein n=1 Tax=Natronococcus occultus SP4 TaxID=694430 RepID=L0K163_9EURY|nr:hypothetical protein [Natronococcus occultus]AGB39047.1 hypothetical protein Natoc_3311 [Natronococcus occultus SP4]
MTVSDRRDPAYAARCPDCEVDLETDAPNEIVDFYRRHYRVTGHDVTFERIEPSLGEAVTEDVLDEVYTLADVVAQLEDEYDDGVPIGAVAAAMSDRGRSIGETLEAAHEIRMNGALYEPRDDHLRAF